MMFGTLSGSSLHEILRQAQDKEKGKKAISHTRHKRQESARHHGEHLSVDETDFVHPTPPPRNISVSVIFNHSLIRVAQHTASKALKHNLCAAAQLRVYLFPIQDKPA